MYGKYTLFYQSPKNWGYMRTCVNCVPDLSSGGFSLTAVDKNQEKAWDHKYFTDQKWWTRLVRNVDSVLL